MLQKSKIAEKVRSEILKYPEIVDEFNHLIIKYKNITIKENMVYDILEKTFKEICKIERNVNCGSYFIDYILKYKNIKIAVECDEFGHKDYDKTKEKEREEYIKLQGYHIIRINPDNKNFDIHKEINKIMKILFN
jgi:very-short-patch-repair endonuclease